MAEADVSFFNDEIKAINAVELHQPELLFLDYNFQGAESANYIDLILSRSPSTSLLLVGENLADEQVMSCLLVGAKGYQNSNKLQMYIDKIINVISEGEAWISRRMTARLLDAIRQQNLLINPGLLSADLYSNVTVAQII
jgi:DNA-binding NarL/FixJ family response regulator